MVQARTKPSVGVMSVLLVFTLLGAEAPFPPWDSPCVLCSRWGRSSGTMLTELENAVNSLIDVYHKYSLQRGNYHALYRDDLKKLLEAECPRYMKVRRGWVWSFSAWLMKP